MAICASGPAPDPADPGPQLTVTEAPSAGFDWREADTVSLVTRGADSYGSSVVDVDPIIEEASDHPEDTYYFGEEVGWLDAAGVAERNGKEFPTICTPDPEER